MKMRKKYSVYSDKKVNEVISNMRKQSTPYSWFAMQINVTDVYFDEKNGHIQICIPWGSGNRRFYGYISEKDGQVLMEGEFKVPRIWMIFHVLFWSIVWIGLGYILVAAPEVLSYIEGLILYGGAMLVFSLHMWFSYFFKNKKYEEKITDFLKKCI